MAITWRNVEGPNFRDAILAGTTAQQQMNTGFDNFNKILEQETKTNLANWDNTKQNNTQEALNELMRYRTPEEYQAAQASGAIDALRQRYGPQMDQDAFRTVVDGRLTTLQQRATAGIDFKNKALADTLRPQEQAALALVANDPSKLPSFLAANPELNKFMGGILAAKGVESARASDLHKYAGNKDVREGEQLQSSIYHQRAMEKIGQTQAAASMMNAKTQEYAVKSKSPSAKGLSSAEEITLSGNPHGDGDLAAKGGLEHLAKSLGSAGYKNEDLTNALAAIKSRFPSGKYSFKDEEGVVQEYRVPVSTIADLILKRQNDNWWMAPAPDAAVDFENKVKTDANFRRLLKIGEEIRYGGAARKLAAESK